MEVLTAYVRQHAHWRSEPTEVPGLAADIQAIITVLRRRTRFFGYGEPERLDLHETNLTGANLSETNFSGADLTGADLSRANLEEAVVWDASLSGANLRKANLTNVNLSGAEHLTQEQLHGTTGDENTQLPPDLKPPAYWNVKTDEQIEGP